MALSNIEVKAEIAAERLVFDPPIPDPDQFGAPSGESRFGSSSVDLLLHEELIFLPKEVTGVKTMPSSETDVMKLLRTFGNTKNLAPGRPETIAPFVRVIGKTLEYMSLPPHIAGRIEGKSTLARYGLAVHCTAPTVMAGYQGRLYLEMYNYGPFPIELEAGMRIAQLVLEHVGLPPIRGYMGRYFRQD